MSKSNEFGCATSDSSASIRWLQGELPDDFHPGIRAIVEYWRSIRPGSGLPGRQHLDPIKIPKLVANIRLIDVVSAPPRFRVRLTGTRLTEFFGSSDTGRWLDEVHPNFDKTPTFLNYMSVIESREPNWRRGQCELRGARHCLDYERIQIPFASDSRKVDMILVYGVFGREGEDMH